MKSINYFLLSLLLIGLSLSKWTYAQDKPCPKHENVLVTRSSPFDPPTTDVFVADDGPGLDTGCTFNTDPEHPLVINVLIDRFVGEVDALGYLVNPDALIANGLIPATVDINMPAYDVDFNGPAPPERDEVFFNGEYVGLLHGDNNIWIYNSFTVDIRKIKFPAEPPPNGTPTPVANTILINVDLLATGRWCTAIDWVALVIPIRPVIGFTLEVKKGNKIRQNNSNNTIDIIYEESFDPDCNLTIITVPKENFPFSGPAKSRFLGLSGEVILHTTIEPCPLNSILEPEVKVEWEIRDTPLKNITSWTGLEGDVTIKMPDKVGAYTVDFTYTINGAKTIIPPRKLFVTRKAPLAKLHTPRRAWYEKATAWASGESDVDIILEKLLDSLYAFGGRNWKYIDRTPCTWKDLVRDPITCNSANCFVFSDVFDNMAATLGIGGLKPINPEGTHEEGFVTTGAPSLDPNFPGNARLLGGSGTFDRYVFGIHSLRKKGIFSPDYYDATFNDIYSNETEFISWNLQPYDNIGKFYPTDEGAIIYERTEYGYFGWGVNDYVPPPPPLASASDISYLLTAENMNMQDIHFTGNVTFNTVDTNGDGFFEAVVADVEVDILTAGEYLIFGSLEKGGNTVANRPAFESMLFSKVNITGTTGINIASLAFSGEQIFQSAENGPYDLLLFATGENGNTSLTIQTPVYDHTQFGETGATIVSVVEVAIDEDSDGKFDFIEATVEINVRTAGDYQLQGNLSKGGESIVDAGSNFTLTSGTNTLKLQFPGIPILRSNLDGPYEVVINIIDTDGHTVGSIEFLTQAYNSLTFGALFDLDGNFNDQGIDINNNGFFDYLRIDFGTIVNKAGTFLVSGVLKNPSEPLVVFTDQEMSLSPGPQTLTLDFFGPLIREQEINGPYQIEVVVRDLNTFEELDRVPLGQMTAAYNFAVFEPFDFSDIMLTGNSTDEGVDTDVNGLFDELHVGVEVELLHSDFYHWSARLVDVNNTEIDFDAQSGSLPSGTTTINFVFDGEKIGMNAVDGPYFVKGLLMFGNTGPNMVANNVAETQFYRFTDFEGAPIIFPFMTMWSVNDDTDGKLQYYTLDVNSAFLNIEGDILGINGEKDLEDLIIDSSPPIENMLPNDGTFYLVNNVGTSTIYKLDFSEFDNDSLTPVNAILVGSTGLPTNPNVYSPEEISSLLVYNGTLYGLSLGAKKLYEISTVDGSVSQIYTLAVAGDFRSDGMTYRPADGTVYLLKTNSIGESEIWKFTSFPSGDIEYVRQIETSGKVEALTAHPDGYLYASDQTRLYQISVTDPYIGYLADYTVDIEGMDYFYDIEVMITTVPTREFIAINDPVPVELESFTAEAKNGKVLLNWQTATEVNNYGFDIERRIDEEEWNNIGFVEGHGNSNSPKEYSFTDKSPVGGSKFSYRLKQIDNDGAYEYSDIVEVEFVPTEFTLYQNYPNPFNPTTRIKYSIPQESNVTIKVFDILGKKVMTLIAEKQEIGIYEIDFDGNNLVSGIYIYQMQAGNFSQTKKMLLMK